MLIKILHLSNYFIALTLMLLVCACAPKEHIAEKQKRLVNEHKILIGSSDPVTFFVPPYTRIDSKIPKAEIYPAAQTSLHDSLTGIEDALAIYPSGFVTSQIDAIFISGEMFFEGMSAGGTYHHSWIIVASTTDPAGESNYDSALYGVHHELSSFIYHQSSIISRFWGDLMPVDWQVKNGYKETLAINNMPIDYKNGFLNNYATTSVENDFNTYAEFVFARSEELIELAKTHSLVAKKLRLFIDAYSKQSPDMAAFFKKSPLLQVSAPYELDVITDKFHIDVSSIKPTIIYPNEQ